MNIQNLTTTGARIRFLMELRDITQTELASRLKINQPRLSKYINDKNEIDFATARLLCKELECSMDFLLLNSDSINSNEFVKDTGKNVVRVKLSNKELYLTEEEVADLINNIEEIGLDVSKYLPK